MLWRRAKQRDQAANPQPAEALRCSFCRKSKDVVQKLVSNPSDYPRAYICDECIAVCNSILEEDGLKPPEASVVKRETDEPHSLLNDPLTSQLLAAVELWIKQESLGVDATEEFSRVRAAAIRLMRPAVGDDSPK